MRVIFLQDVPRVARAGEIKEVANGYGRNFLIPLQLALLAKPQAASNVEIQLKVKARSQATEEARILELANQLDGKEISLTARVGAKDRLYGSITAADIASELESATGLVVDKRKIELDEPIRQVGSYEITIKLAKDIVPKIKVAIAEEPSQSV
jgi:large subunit ribosomal protein L9